MKKILKTFRFILLDPYVRVYFLYALGMLAMIFGLTFVAFYPLMREARLVATDTLPGIIYSAEVNTGLDDNFIRLLVGSSSEFVGKVEEMIDTIDRDTLRNDELLGKYQASIFEDEDRRNFDRFTVARRTFIGLRKHFFDELKTNPQRAVESLNRVLLPAYKQYRAEGRLLVAYNARIGQQRSARIEQFAVYTLTFAIFAPLILAVAGVMLGIKLFKL